MEEEEKEEEEEEEEEEVTVSEHVALVNSEHVALVNSIITPSITGKITACFSVFSAVDLLVKNKFALLEFEAYTLCRWRRLLHSGIEGHAHAGHLEANGFRQGRH